MQKSRSLSVTMLNNYIKGMFEDELILHNITVFGEVEEIKNSGNNTYITLIDGVSRLSCVKFSPTYDVKIGDSVTLTGGIKFYDKSSKVSFIARTITVSGAGDNFAEFTELKNKLEKEGVFDNKKPYPSVINRVCIITSEKGAVISDFISIIKKENLKLDIKLIDVNVQGDNASDSIVNAIKIVNGNDICDICVLMRGGGSASDLSVFNSEAVARAVASCKTHIISAVGHENDITLCDFSASSRAGTPSIASKQIVDYCIALRDKVNNLSLRLQDAIVNIYANNYQKFLHSEMALVSSIEKKIIKAENVLRLYSSDMQHSVDKIISNSFSSLVQASGNVSSLVKSLVDKAENNLSRSSYNLDAHSPLKAVSKGYAITEHGGKKVTSVQNIKSGDKINLIYIDGSVVAQVEEVKEFKK